MSDCKAFNAQVEIEQINKNIRMLLDVIKKSSEVTRTHAEAIREMQAIISSPNRNKPKDKRAARWKAAAKKYKAERDEALLFLNEVRHAVGPILGDCRNAEDRERELELSERLDDFLNKGTK